MCLFVSGIEPEENRPHQRRAIIVSAITGDIVAEITFGDSVSDQYIRAVAPRLVTDRKRNRRNGANR